MKKRNDMIRKLFLSGMVYFLSGTGIYMTGTAFSQEVRSEELVCARGYIMALRIHSRFGKDDDQNGNGNRDNINVAVIVDDTGFKKADFPDDSYNILKVGPPAPLNKWVHIAKRGGGPSVTDRRWMTDVALLSAAQASRTPVRIISYNKKGCVETDPNLEIRLCASEADCNQY